MAWWGAAWGQTGGRRKRSWRGQQEVKSTSEIKNNQRWRFFWLFCFVFQFSKVARFFNRFMAWKVAWVCFHAFPPFSSGAAFLTGWPPKTRKQDGGKTKVTRVALKLKIAILFHNYFNNKSYNNTFLWKNFILPWFNDLVKNRRKKVLPSKKKHIFMDFSTQDCFASAIFRVATVKNTFSWFSAKRKIR